ncbi:MAG: excinuclease ABC subunit UvrB [Patescibacteria group bacterium]
MKFALSSKFKPTGDQPRAIKQLISGLTKGFRDQTLLGVTGSGKTFTMANVIQAVQRPTLIISHNKTLAAQLASEFEDFFPKNAVHYFVSYYDYYQPEAYIPRSDTYIEKETQINDEIERLRHASTQSLLSRKDVIIVASVSAIYGLGNPAEYKSHSVKINKGEKIKRSVFLRKLVDMHYERNQIDLWRGRFRVLGDTVELFPAVSEKTIFRIHFFGDEIEKIEEADIVTNRTLARLDSLSVYPATHYLPGEDNIDDILLHIETDLEKRVKEFKRQDKPLEAERITQRTKFDIEMIKETGYCNGIENYSRYFDGRAPGTPPYTLVDFFPKNFLLFIDESHMTVPQIGGMYEGDKSRKSVLIDYGFRLPAALDNRPLTYREFDKKINQVIYVSATPSLYEKEKSKQTAEQLIRPTGLLDPDVEIKPVKHQIDDLLEQIQRRVEKKQRVLVTTLTKRMSEDLAEYLDNVNVKVAYLHSEVDTMERLEILRDLRLGTYDVLVGINLLREGLDLPEVSLIAILDADKEGFLRSNTSLIQTMGRAARHSEGHVIMYADTITGSMRTAIDEVTRRRKHQQTYNVKHRITPKTISKAIKESRLAGKKTEERHDEIDPRTIPKDELQHIIADLQEQMDIAAQNLEFEKAAKLRDQISELQKTIPHKKIKPRRNR